LEIKDLEKEDGRPRESQVEAKMLVEMLLHHTFNLEALNQEYNARDPKANLSKVYYKLLSRAFETLTNDG